MLKVVHYPGFAKEKQGGTILQPFCTVMDLCPTILDLAGIKHPAVDGKQGVFRGRSVAPMRGKSWVSQEFISASMHFSDIACLGSIHDGDKFKQQHFNGQYSWR